MRFGQSVTIGGHEFIVRKFTDERRAAAARVLSENLDTVLKSRGGALPETTSAAMNRLALSRVVAALMDPEYCTVRRQAKGPEQAMTPAVAAETVTTPAMQLRLLTEIARLNFFAEFEDAPHVAQHDLPVWRGDRFL